MMMERAGELIRPYVGRAGVIGAYLVGSATRPQRDELSDLDIEVVVEDDAYESTPDDERQVFAYKDADRRTVDYEFYLWPWSGFVGLAASTQDLFHYPYQHAIVLHDPQGQIAPVIATLAELPASVRADRLRVHYLEFRFALGRARKTRERGGNLNLALLYGDALKALSKTLFLSLSSWPATHHWTEQELRFLGVPPSVVEGMAATFADPTPDRLKALVTTVDDWLDSCGETFHREIGPLVAWAFHRVEGRGAFESWAGR